jgi:TolB-like protein
MKFKFWFQLLAIFFVFILSCSGGSHYVNHDNVIDDQVAEKDRKVIGVLEFEDRTVDTEKFRPWGRGIPEQIMERLSAIPYLRIVARDFILKAVLSEHEFQMTGTTDQASTAQLGKMLNARYLVRGSYQIIGNEMQIRAMVLDVESAQVIHTISSRGPYVNFFDLQNDIAIKITEGMNVQLNSVVKEKIRSEFDTKVVDASLANYRGESLLDEITILEKSKKTERVKEIKAEAKSLFKSAITFDPNYERAKRNFRKMVQSMPLTL